MSARRFPGRIREINGCDHCRAAHTAVTEAVYQQLDGVMDVVPGYSGGTAETAGYRIVSSGATEVGATEEEIAEALAVAWSQGGGTQVFWMKEEFDEVLGEGWRRTFLPEADRAFRVFEAEIFEEGSLPRKAKELIAVAVSCMLRCRHCTRSHMEAALEHRATPAEIAEALGVLWVIGSGVQIVWNRDGFEKHLRGDR